MSRTAMESKLNQIFNDSADVTATDVKNLARTHYFTFQKPGAATTGDDAAAGTDFTDYTVFSNDTGNTITITGATYRCGNTGFTQSASVNSTLTLTKRDSAGANSTSVATMTTDLVANGGVGTLTAGQSGAFTLTATLANRIVPVGGCLLLSKTHASTGTVIPGGSITLTYTED